METTSSELSKNLGITRRYADYLLKGERAASQKMAEKLEEATGRHRLFWLYPGRYSPDGNPIQAQAAADV